MVLENCSKPINMIISEKLYYSDDIKERKKKKIINKIKKNKNLQGIFFIVIKEGDANLMEVVNSSELYRLDRKASVIVIGVTKSRDEAKFLVQTIIEDHLRLNAITKENLIKEFA